MQNSLVNSLQAKHQQISSNRTTQLSHHRPQIRLANRRHCVLYKFIYLLKFIYLPHHHSQPCHRFDWMLTRFYHNVTWDHTSIPAKWHLIPFDGFSRVHECDRQMDRPRYGNICLLIWTLLLPFCPVMHLLTYSTTVRQTNHAMVTYITTGRIAFRVRRLDSQWEWYKADCWVSCQ